MNPCRLSPDLRDYLIVDRGGIRFRELDSAFVYWAFMN